MAQPLFIARYHDAVISALKNIRWVRDADTYPEKNIPRYNGLRTPAVYFTLNSWEPAEQTTGQMAVSLFCDLSIVTERTAEGVTKPDIFLRSAAADISQWIEGQLFGLDGLGPAVFTGAEQDEFDPRMDEYLVWRVSFTQQASLGPDPFESTGHPLREVWLGLSPETGLQHVDDYHLIYERKSHD